MKTKTLFFLMLLAVWLFPAASQAALSDGESFVVETSEEDLDDSLNRIAGTIDRGFASEDQTYEAEHHGRTSPLDPKY